MLSIIVPLYKGKRYINSILSNIEKAIDGIDIKTQLIFVNDYPNEQIEQITSKSMEVMIINNRNNIGIHGARVKGYYASEGDIIHFLDQDDFVDNNFYTTQIAALTDCDAVISLAYDNNSIKYRSIEELKKSIGLEEMLKNGNRIMSPGQVLLKRSSIPDKWLNNIFKHNGADDYFLWLCMLYENRTFAINPNSYFHHTITKGENASEDFVSMLMSKREMYLYLSDNYLPRDKMMLTDYAAREDFEQYQKMGTTNSFFESWMILKDNKISIAEYFRNKNISRISIYGMGKMGKHLFYDLKDKINVECIFDRNVKEIDSYKVVDYDKERISGKNIIISILYHNEHIKEKLKKDGNNVFVLSDVVAELSAGL